MKGLLVPPPAKNITSISAFIRRRGQKRCNTRSWSNEFVLTLSSNASKSRLKKTSDGLHCTNGRYEQVPMVPTCFEFLEASFDALPIAEVARQHNQSRNIGHFRQALGIAAQSNDLPAVRNQSSRQLATDVCCNPKYKGHTFC